MNRVFADPKTDVIFKKIFGQKAHKSLLIELLNSLLELDEAHRIIDIEYLTPEQLPPRQNLKLSILDVKCTDARGTYYAVEMQVIEVEGFQKRIVYNACKAYSTQLAGGEEYPRLNDVIAVTLCDFVLWPQRTEDGAAYRVPMLSRWRMQEQHGGAPGLPEVQYVFLELPKYEAGKRPLTTVEKWTYLFREAPSLERVPEELAEGPYAEALEVARRANLSPDEWTEYDRAKIAKQDFLGGLSLAEKRGEQRGEERGEKRGEERGEKRGHERGQVTGIAQSILMVLSARGVQAGEALRSRILATTDVETLTRWLTRAATIASADELDA